MIWKTKLTQTTMRVQEDHMETFSSVCRMQKTVYFPFSSESVFNYEGPCNLPWQSGFRRWWMGGEHIQHIAFVATGL